MLTGQGSKEIAISFTIALIVWIQRGGADRSPKDMHDRQRL